MLNFLWKLTRLSKYVNFSFANYFTNLLQDFYDILDEEDVVLSPQCPFHAENNIFRPVKQNYKIKRNRWKCKLCNVNARSEMEVYDHILSSHPEIFDDHVYRNFKIHYKNLY